MPDDSATDAELIARSRADPEVFGHVFDRHARAVHAFVARRAGRQAADDVLGEVFTVAFEGRRQYDLRHDRALPWLYGIAHNLVRARARREGRQHAIGLRLGRERPFHPWDDVDSRIDAERTVSGAAAALAALPPGERDVVQLVAWEDLPLTQVARVLRIPEGTARSRLHRARAALRAQLGTPPPDEPIPTGERGYCATAIPGAGRLRTDTPSVPPVEA